VVHFVNADLIATGLSPLKPELAAIAAARLVLREIDRLAAERMDFAFETTFSGLTNVRRLRAWKQKALATRSLTDLASSFHIILRRGVAAKANLWKRYTPKAFRIHTKNVLL
jgi:hypothetical protein